MEKTNYTLSAPPQSPFKRILYPFIIISLLLIAMILAGELTVRIFCFKKYATSPIPPPYNTAQKDDLLGWKMTPNYSFSGNMKDAAGRDYPIDIKYDYNGFKAFGDPASPKPKLFFIGDSYTASIEASNEKSFFSLIGDSLDCEVFAYGHAGYGNLQEYMILNIWMDKIHPDIVVWEVCSNDFIDNCAALEKVCGYKVGERRPYLQHDGSITYERPLSLFDKIQEHFWCLKWLEEKWINVFANIKGDTPQVGEYYISTQNRSFPPFNESVLTTELIFKKSKLILANTPVIGFTADLYEPQASTFRSIFESNGFIFLDDPAKLVNHAQFQKEEVVRSIDYYHWNELGHEYIATGLIPHIREAVKAKGLAAKE